MTTKTLNLISVKNIFDYSNHTFPYDVQVQVLNEYFNRVLRTVGECARPLDYFVRKRQRTITSTHFLFLSCMIAHCLYFRLFSLLSDNYIRNLRSVWVSHFLITLPWFQFHVVLFQFNTKLLIGIYQTCIVWLKIFNAWSYC